jgi:SAM-dependent methyltransferase
VAGDDRIRRSYDAVAPVYAAALGAELRQKPLDRALLDAFAETAGDGIVADVGCGPGHIAAYLAGRGVPVIGLDLSPGMCATGRRATALPFAAADMTALPVGAGRLAGLICFYAVIHLPADGRRRAYREFARVLRAGAQALIAFHTGDAETPTGGSRRATELLGQAVDLTFHFLDPAAEADALAAAGLHEVARLDRHPQGAEHPSRRSYLLVRRGGCAP